MATLSTRLTNIVGDRTAQVLEKSFGITTVNELLRHYPRRYVVRGELTDISTLVADDEVTILAEIEAVKLRRANGKNILEVVVTDGSANLSLTFFDGGKLFSSSGDSCSMIWDVEKQIASHVFKGSTGQGA